MNDERVRELVVDAYRDVRLDVPLAAIEEPDRRRSRRTPALVAAAAAVLAVTAGVSVLARGADPVAVVADGVEESASSPPSVSVPAGECLGPASLPPAEPTSLVHRIDVPEFSLALFADERSLLVCWQAPLALVKDSSVPALYPAGSLSGSSTTLVRGTESLGFAFGRTPAGTTAVTVHFADGTSMPAKLDGEWYVAAATGADAGRFNTVVRVVAQTPSGPVTHIEPRA
jgi:hypothetical protein